MARKRQNRLVILSEPSPPSEYDPIFVVACPRSGSSLLRRILDSHSGIACPPESHFLRPLVAILADRRSNLGFKAMGFDRQTTLDRTRVFAEQFFLDYAQVNGKRRWADKTPMYVNCLEEIDELFGGNARFLMLYRHGLDVAYSMLEAYGELLYTLDPPKPDSDDHLLVRTAAKYWAEMTSRMLEFEARNPDRTMTLHYETLTTAPQRVLPEIFAFLGELFEPQTLAFNDRPHDEGIEDGRVRGTRTFMPSIGNHKKLGSAELVAASEEAAKVLTRLGYSVAPVRS